jgi:hypothetical protein
MFLLKKIIKRLSRRYERGYAMAWNAIFLAFVVVPLCVLCVDVVRALYVRTHLQTATDAACEAAANALDLPTFRATGVGRIDMNQGVGWAAQQFNQTVVDQGIVEYSPSLGSVTLLSPTVVSCSSVAHVHNLIPVAPDLVPKAYSVSELRVGRR